MQSKTNITVFGASGKIGQALLKLLSDWSVPTIAVSRTPPADAPLPGITWMQADMNDPQSLYNTVTNTDAVFLLSSVSNDIVQQQINVIDVAKTQGVRHIVKLSSGAADKNAESYIARVHGEIEIYLQQSGVASTMLRPNGFMQNWLTEFPASIKAEHKIYGATGHGKRPYIDLRDIAAVAFTILCKPEPHAGKVYTLTGDEALSHPQLAALISNVTGETVTYEDLSPEANTERLRARGMPEWALQSFTAYVAFQRAGHAAAVSPDVATVLQRPARTAQAFFEEYAALFK